MLKWLLAVLLLANALFFAYTEGWLASLGLAPVTQREPERLAQQVDAERLEVSNATPLAEPAAVPATPAAILPEGAAPTSTTAPVQPGESAEAPITAPVAAPALAPVAAAVPPPPVTPPVVPASPPMPTACWQASGFTAAQTIVLHAALQELPGLTSKRWALNENVLPARWIVYLGKFPNPEALQRRRSELRESKVEYRDVNNVTLQPGLALGTYSAEEAAQTALRDVARKGVRDAKVVQERQEQRSVTLKLPAVTDVERKQVQSMKALAGKTLQPCA